MLIDTGGIGLTPEAFTRPLTCPDPGCGVGVAPVREHSRTTETRGTSTVAAHFRLHPGTRHHPTCQYDPDGIIATIAANSEGTATAVPGRLRLLVPADFTGTTRTTSPDPGGRRTALQIAAGPSSMSPVIGSAAAIQRFLDRYPDDPQAAAMFHISYAGRDIAWADFCFGDDPIALLHLTRRITKGQGPDHPIAIRGTLTGTGVARAGTSFYAEQDLRTRIVLAGRSRPLYVRIRSRDERLIETVAAGRRYLALGAWSAFAPAAGGLAELVLWLRKPWQVHVWSEGGQALTI
ncbi:hypothetical protein [Catenulispora rubra]|uniref:hypothetical protein n=1 Tax=Catenulispora rubra TaxID=280293 RepID=UPI0018923C41|nr:hypothetical protein [Catenulispora rubra]